VKRAAGTIAVLVNNLEGVFQLSVLQGAEEVAAANGFGLAAHPLVGLRSPDAVRAEVAEAISGASGVLVLANAVADDDLAVVAESGLPVTLISHRTQHLELPTMMFDNHQGVALLMQHVVEACGRRLPVFVGGDTSQLDGQERESAFRDEAVRHGLTVPPENYLRGEFTPRLAADALAAFLAGGGQCDAVIAADYLMAIEAQAVVLAAGLRVPDDLAVVGFGDGPEAEAAGVTTVAADVVELGRRAARQLMAQLSGQPLVGSTLLSTHLVRRSSSC